MKNCKNYTIFKFKYGTPIGEDKVRAEFNKRIQAHHAFFALFLPFATGFSQEYWIKKAMNPITGAMGLETALIYLEEQREYQWLRYSKSLYLAIPNTEPDIITFVYLHKPQWVTTIKRI